MARKKIVYVIVEGPSDEMALGLLLQKLYDQQVVYLEIMHGDVTSKDDANVGNIVSKIGNLIKKYASYNSYKPQDFLEIIHIIDTDGAYIPNEQIIEDKSLTDVVYTEEEIICSNKPKIEARNANKSSVMDKLVSVKVMWKCIPYRVFYMACNLDHVLYNKLNCTDDEKETNSYMFAKRYRDDILHFVEFISESPFSRVEGYKESWEYIRKGTNSLKRNTNLGICLKKICGTPKLENMDSKKENREI